MADKIEVDAQTGQVRVVPMSSEEAATLASAVAALAPDVAERQTANTNQGVISDSLQSQIATLETVYTALATQPITRAQAQEMCLALLRIARLLVGQLDVAP
jgi:hypothetical protein